MRKIDIIYTNLLALLSKLTPSDEDFNAYFEICPEDKQDRLLDISEQLLNEKTRIHDVAGTLAFFPDYANLIELLDQFKNEYGDYGAFRKNELYAIITLIQKLTTEFSGVEVLHLEENIDIDVFSVIPLQQEINQDNYLCYDNINFENSLFLFNINKKEEFKIYVDSLSAESHLLYYLLSKIGIANKPLTAEKYVFIRNEFSTKPKIVWATICLHIIKTGNIIHSSSEYTLTPKIAPNCKIELGKNYQQFADSIDIISEYNYQTDILDKYLRVYHVLENFMYKSPLVNLEREAAGHVFSIRDFKRMYDKISDSELNMLTKLMQEVLPLEYIAGQTFNQKLLVDWTSLIGNPFADESRINDLLKILNIKTTKGTDINFAYVTLETFPKFLGKLIYSYRNSMVHNRETEFHLTHQSLTNHPFIGDTAKIILEQFVLPSIEEIVFNLIIVENNVVWYDRSKLQLWEEN